MLSSVGIILLLILLNGLLAMTEMAVVNAKTIRLQAAADSGSRGARQALALITNPSQFLSTIQVGITLIGILAGAYGERSVAKELKAWLESGVFFRAYAETIALGIVVLGVTMANVVLGEIIPKRLALLYPETIAMTTSGPVRLLAIIAAPLVNLLVSVTEFLLRLFGLARTPVQSVTEEEIRGLIGEGARTGVLDAAESEIMDKVLRLADRRISAVMTPRADLEWLDTTLPEEENRRRIINSPQGFYPVCSGGPDDVVGLLNAGDALSALLKGRPLHLLSLMKRPLVLPENVSVLQGLDAFRKSPNQVAFVADEYGAILGVVSQNDVLEALVGELPSPEEPTATTNLVRRPDGTYLVDGGTPVDEVKRLFRIQHLPGESEFDTLAGFVLYQMQAIPREGDSFEFGGIQFEVMDMDGMRVDKVLIRPPAVTLTEPKPRGE
jgi:putative hemolysin